MVTHPSTHGISANFIQKILRIKDGPEGIGPLRPARSQDGLRLEKIARAISQSIISSRQLLLTTGFGVHRSQQIPVRLPALLLPGLQIMERFHKAGMPVPTLLAYQATEFIAETNGLDPIQTRECAQKMETYLRKYVDHFHASIAQKVVLRFNTSYSEQNREDVDRCIADIRSRMYLTEGMPEVLESLQNGERRQSNSTNKFEAYAAANALFSGAVGQYPFADDLPDKTEGIIPIGGNAEKPFFAITSTLADQTKKIVIPMITPLGSRPTYYPYPSSEDPLSIDSYRKAIEHPLKDGPLRTDITALYADGATPEALSSIYSPSSL